MGLPFPCLNPFNMGLFLNSILILTHAGKKQQIRGGMKQYEGILLSVVTQMRSSMGLLACLLETRTGKARGKQPTGRLLSFRSIDCEKGIGLFNAYAPFISNEYIIQCQIISISRHEFYSSGLASLNRLNSIVIIKYV